MSNTNPEELADKAMQPGTFNILDVLKDRAHPSDDVTIYVDEQTAYDASKVQDEIDELRGKESAGGFILDDSSQKRLDELIEIRDTFVEVLNKSKYVITLNGISEGERETILERAVEKYPYEYTEDKNPFTGETTKKEVENPKLNRYFTDLLWFAHIKKITSANGAVQESFTEAEIIEFRNLLPVSAVGAITEAIEKLRVSTAIFMMKVDEDFLAKS